MPRPDRPLTNHHDHPDTLGGVSLKSLVERLIDHTYDTLATVVIATIASSVTVHLL